MNIVDLHPEDLLDKEIDGVLTHDERTRLDAHLRGCSACSFERGSRAAFKADFESLGRSLQRQGMLTLAMKAGQPEPRVREVSWLARNRRVRPFLLIAAAFLLMATGALAAKWSEGRQLFLPRAAPAQAPPANVTAHPKTKVGGALRSDTELPRLAPPEAAPSPMTALPEAPASAPAAESLPVAPPPHEAPVAAAPEAARVSTPLAAQLPRTAGTRATGLRSPFAHADSPSLAAAPIQAVNPPVQRPEESSAATLFDAANRARREGAYDRAISLYGDLEGRFATAPEATSAEAILGRLFLDRGDPKEALRRFDSYVARGGGALREEALVGRAKALRHLGREFEEREAWGVLLSEFPRSVYADEARSRAAVLPSARSF